MTTSVRLPTVEDDMDKLLLTPTEAAETLGIGRSKVYELLQTGQLRSVRIGTCRRIPADALQALVAALRDAS
jgi:excisionase family DNA binding protein